MSFDEEHRDEHELCALEIHRLREELANARAFSNYQQQADRTNLDSYDKVQMRMSAELFTRLMHAAMGLTTEAGEFMDALKKHAMYGKPIDNTNLKEEIGDLLWYAALALNTLGASFEEVMATNIEKLKARFPNRFTEHDALNRDLDNERKILEKAT